LALSPWRIAAWGTAAALLLLPAFAMRFTDEVRWDAADFVVFGTMLAVACGTCELAAKTSGSGAYRAAVGVAVAAAFVLAWMNLAVGIIESEDDPANLMFAGVLAVGIVGAIVARFRARGLARAMLATALAQMLVAAIALGAGMHAGGDSPAAEVIALSGCFTGLWLLSAWLFRKAAREQPRARRGAAG
jgi:hypothetical protein